MIGRITDAVSYSIVEIEIDALMKSMPQEAELRPEWITAAEWTEAELLTNERRRRQWLGGRLAAKRALQIALGRHRQLPSGFRWQHLNIRSRDHSGRPTPPRCWYRQSPLPALVSISHSEGWATAAASCFFSVGVDLVAKVEEQRLHCDAWRWAAAEAVFKSCRFDRGFEPGRWLLFNADSPLPVFALNGTELNVQILRRPEYWLALCLRSPAAASKLANASRRAATGRKRRANVTCLQYAI
jgi:phosphopantetheinyl transferase (holo-ACP synthase)